MLRVYFCRLPAEKAAVPAELLSAYRRRKLEGQKNARVRLQSAASELLLRHALRDCGFPVEGALDLAAEENGKPFLKSGGCFFSLSHSADAVLCAVSERDLGADIQLRTEAKTALIRRFYAPDEQAFVCGAADPAAAFTEIWTKKESFCKRDGRGLALPLGSFSVLDEAISPLLWHETAGEYHLALCSDAVMTGPPDLIEVKSDVLFP